MIDSSFRMGVIMNHSKVVLSVFILSMISTAECVAEDVLSIPEGLIRHEAHERSDSPNLAGKNLKEQQALAADQFDSPQQMYHASCTQCHETGVGRVLFGRSLDANYIIYIIRNGRADMPAFKPTDYSDSDLQQLAQWVTEQPNLKGKHLEDQQALATLKYEGAQQMYQMLCAQCHEAGVGGALLGRSLDANFIMHITRNGTTGMPAFNPADYPDSAVQQLVNWIVEQHKSAEKQGGDD